MQRVLKYHLLLQVQTGNGFTDLKCRATNWESAQLFKESMAIQTRWLNLTLGLMFCTHLTVLVCSSPGTFGACSLISGHHNGSCKAWNKSQHCPNFNCCWSDSNRAHAYLILLLFPINENILSPTVRWALGNLANVMAAVSVSIRVATWGRYSPHVYFMLAPLRHRISAESHCETTPSAWLRSRIQSQYFTPLGKSTINEWSDTILIYLGRVSRISPSNSDSGEHHLFLESERRGAACQLIAK